MDWVGHEISTVVLKYKNILKEIQKIAVQIYILE